MATTAHPASADAPHLASPDETPSLIKGLFRGEIREDLIFPFPQLSAEEKESLAMVLDSFRSFAADNVEAAKNEHDGRFPDAMREAFHALGFMGMNIPEAYCGFGASAKVFNRVIGDIGGTGSARVV